MDNVVVLITTVQQIVVLRQHANITMIGIHNVYLGLSNHHLQQKRRQAQLKHPIVRIDDRSFLVLASLSLQKNVVLFMDNVVEQDGQVQLNVALVLHVSTKNSIIHNVYQHLQRRQLPRAQLSHPARPVLQRKQQQLVTMVDKMALQLVIGIVVKQVAVGRVKPV